LSVPVPAPSSEIGRAIPGPFTVTIDVPLATAGEADASNVTRETMTTRSVRIFTHALTPAGAVRFRGSRATLGADAVAR
jgi:hypothetical protein